MKTRISTIVVLSVFFFGTFAPYKALSGGWGIERGRANEGDVARPLVDQLTGAGVTVKIDRNKRGAYPVIFAFTYADQDSESNFSASDSTEFELIHTPKPDKLPPRGPEPTRKPLKPSPRINRVGD